MFPNFVSRFVGTSSYYSPKSLLASFVASALGEFFVVDPSLVESNLLSDTKIVLKQLQLKQQNVVVGRDDDSLLFVLEGSVGQVEFSWTWGGDEKTPFIRETLLTIQGAKFGLRRASSRRAEDGDGDASGQEREEDGKHNYNRKSNDAPAGGPSSASSNQKKKAETMGCLERHFQQILDHVTLRIIDFELSLETTTTTETSSPAKQEAVILRAESLCLVSFGRDDAEQQEDGTSQTPPLLTQRISFDSLSAAIRTNDDEGNSSLLPLLDPVGYAAMVSRVTGRRFVDGFLRGIEVWGELLNDGQLTFHVGPQQARVLDDVVDMLMMAVGEPQKKTSLGAEADDDGDYDFVDRLEEAEPPSFSSHAPSTLVVLPLPAVQVHLKDNHQDDDADAAAQADIRVPGCTFRCRMDGSDCRLEGSEGIHANEGRWKILSLEDGASWCFDMVKKVFEVSSRENSSNQAMARVNWIETEAKLLLQRVRTLSKSTSQRTVAEVERTVAREFEVWQEENQSSIWTVQMKVPTSLRVDGEHGEWVDASIDPLSIGVVPAVGQVQHLELGSMTVGPTSSGKASLLLPPSSLMVAADSSSLLFQGAIELQAPSVECLTDLSTFLSRVVSGVTKDDKQTPEKASAGLFLPSKPELPFQVIAPRLVAAVEVPTTMSLEAKQIRITTDGKVGVESVKCNQQGTNAFDASLGGLNIDVVGRSLVIDRVESFRAAGLVQLEEPARKLTAKLAGNVVGIHVGSIRATPLVDATNRSEGGGASSTPISSPYVVHSRIDHLQLEPSKLISASFGMRGIDVLMRSNEYGLLELKMNSPLKLRVEKSEQEEWVDLLLEFLSVRANGSGGLKSLDVGGCVMGPASFANMRLRLPASCLSSDGNTNQLIFREPISVAVPNMGALSKLYGFSSSLLPNGAAEKPSSDTTVDLPFDVLMAQFSVIVEDSNGSFTAGGIRLTKPGELSIADVVGSQGDDFRLAANGLVASASSRTVQVKEIKSLVVPGLLQLNEPVTDVHATVQDEGAMLVSLDMVHASPCDKEPVVEARSSGGDDRTSEAMALPFPVRLRLDKLRLSPRSLSATIRVRGIDVLAQSLDNGDIELKLLSETKIRLEKSGVEWVQSSIHPSTAIMETSAEGYVNVKHFSNSGICLGPTSFGHIKIEVPTVEIDEMVRLSSGVNAEIASRETVEAIKAFLVASLFPQRIEESATTAATTDMARPMPMVASTAKIQVLDQNLSVIAHGIGWTETSLRCQSLGIVQSPGISVSLSGAKVKLQSEPCGSVEVVDRLTVPGVVDLAEPLRGMCFTFKKNHVLETDIPTVSLMLPIKEQKIHRGGVVGFKNPLPFPLMVRVKKVFVELRSSVGSKASFENVDAKFEPLDESVSITSMQKVTARVESSPSGRWVELEAHTVRALVSPTASGWLPTYVLCGGCHVGPSSVDPISVDVPPFEMPLCSKTIRFQGDLSVTIQSNDVLMEIQSIVEPFSSYFSNKSEPSPYDVSLPKLIVKVSEPMAARATLEDVTASRTRAACERLTMTATSGASAALSGITAAVGSDVDVTIEWIESMFIPDACSLEKPIQRTLLRYNKQQCRALLHDVHVSMIRSSNTSMESTSMPSIPFPVAARLERLNVRHSGDKTVVTTASNLQILAGPKTLDPFVPVGQQAKGTEFSLSLDRASNEMFDLGSANIAGVIMVGEPDKIRNLRFSSTGNTTIVAGFSSVEWSKVLGGGESSDARVVSLPFVCIESMTMRLKYRGSVVQTASSVVVPKFVGGARTDSDEVAAHFKRCVLSRVPTFITNVEIMGQNATEMAAKGAGIAAIGGRTVTGSIGGSVTGLVAIDSVRGAISSGKKARGATDADGYQFGDVARGTVRSFREAAKSGAEVRRGDSGRYQVGDVTVGALKSTGEYISENKARLGSAGGSGAGMLVGAALLGPVGLLAGGLAGSMAGGRAFGGGSKEELTEGHGTATQHTPPNSAGPPASGFYHQETTVSQTQRVSVDRASSDYDLLGYEQHTTTTRRSVTSLEAADPSKPAYCEQQYQHQQTQQNFRQSQYQEQSHRPTHGHPRATQTQHAQEHRTHSTYTTTTTRVSTTAATATTMTNSSFRGAPPTTSPYANREAATSRAPPRQHQSQQQLQQERTGYRLGDVTRSVIAKGKEKDGRGANDGYKFGDFTRGLFK